MYNLEGKKQANKIIYYDGKYTNILIIGTNEIELIRKNKEVQYKLEFKINKNTNCKYELKIYKIFINIEVYTQNIEINKNTIKVKYTQKIDDQFQNYEYILKWEELK